MSLGSKMRSGRGQRGLRPPFSLTPTEGPRPEHRKQLPNHTRPHALSRHGKRKLNTSGSLLKQLVTWDALSSKTQAALPLTLGF